MGETVKLGEQLRARRGLLTLIGLKLLQERGCRALVRKQMAFLIHPAVSEPQLPPALHGICVSRWKGT